MKHPFKGLFFGISISLLLWGLIFVGWSYGATYYVDSDKGIDTSTGNKDEAVKTLVGVDKLMATMTDKDTLSITGTPVWAVQMGTLDGHPVYDSKEGCIQHHLIIGGKMRTVIEIGKTRLIGTSAIGEKGEIETVIEKVEVIK